MKTIRITALRQTLYTDLMEQYELPQEMPCCLQVGQTFLSVNAEMPQGFCPEAWKTLQPFVLQLAQGHGNIYGNWMKDPHSALLSCNDGFRPMSFLLETLPETTAETKEH